MVAMVALSVTRRVIVAIAAQRRATTRRMCDLDRRFAVSSGSSG
jgi:hypothetical protein